MDPIADMLTRIRNAYQNRKTSLVASSSKMKEALLAILVENKFISGFKVTDGQIKIDLLYKKEAGFKRPALTKIVRVSKPSLRVYKSADQIPKVPRGLGIIIVSTSKGLMTGKEAQKEVLGGEIVCRVW